MEKIQFGNYGARYNIESIQPVAVHILRIIYSSTIPAESLYSEDIIVYSQGDIKETTLTGWNTVYYYDGENRTVYLSDDGSVWTEPEEPEPQSEPEPYEPTVEELQSSKISEMKATCDKTETEGTDVTLSDGSVEHFGLTLDNYIDIMLRQFKIDSGASQIDYHADGKPSEYYSAEDMQTIINAAYDFMDYQETYCNELCLWIESLTDKDEIEAVWYGMDIPEERRSGVLSDLIFHSKDELHDSAGDEEGPDKDDSGDNGDDDDDDNQNAGGRLDLGGGD